mgnify:FL=1|jgi:Mg2+ and Co2+ transporter CorA
MNGEFLQMIEDTKEELDSICKWINDKNQFDSKTRYLISYAAVKASGTVEVIFKNMIYNYLIVGANEKAKGYLEKAIIDSSCNPNTGNMSNMLQNISPEWRTLFDQQVKQSGEKDKLNSLVQLRNDFAHGGSILVSIETVIKYFDSAVKILNILDNVCT